MKDIKVIIKKAGKRDGSRANTVTSSKLGKAVLGTMKLGKA